MRLRKATGLSDSDRSSDSCGHGTRIRELPRHGENVGAGLANQRHRQPGNRIEAEQHVSLLGEKGADLLARTALSRERWLANFQQQHRTETRQSVSRTLQHEPFVALDVDFDDVHAGQTLLLNQAVESGGGDGLARFTPPSPP